MTEPSWLDAADRTSPWQDLSVVVAGIGTAGYSAAAALLTVGASVVVVDHRDDEEVRRKATILETLNAGVRLGSGATTDLPDRCDLVVTSAGWRPDAPLPRAARTRGVPVFGEVDLALRLGDPERSTRWLTVANARGHRNTVTMLAYMLRAAGLRTAPVGNNGVPLCDVVLDPEPYDVLAVELSSQQLHWSRSLRPRAAALLGVGMGASRAQLDWHGSPDAYVEALGKAYADCELACVYQLADPLTEDLVREADVVEGCRAIGVTQGVPNVGMIGMVEDTIADRAFVTERATSAAELGTLADVPQLGGPILDEVLVAAALARAQGVPPVAVRTGLADFRAGLDA